MGTSIGDEITDVRVRCERETHCFWVFFFSFPGYYAEQNAIIVFAACFLPDSNCDNYNYVMENLFL